VAKKDDSASLPGAFVKCPVGLLADQRLTDAELRLWLTLVAYCMKSDSCYPSTKRLSEALRKSRTWIKTLILALESKGFLVREYRNGKAALYRPLVSNNRSTPLDHLTDEGGQPHLTTPVNSTCPQRSSPGFTSPRNDSRNRDEIDKRNRRKKQSTEPSAQDTSKPKTKKLTDPRVKEILEAFCSAYLEKFGVKYTVSGGRDGAIIKNLLADHSAEMLTRCITSFFADTDQWLVGKYNLPVFRSRINQYVQETTPAKAPEPARQTQRLRDVTY